MRKENCGVCGKEIFTEQAKMHYIVPREIAKQAGLPGLMGVWLCADCYREVENWYLKRVSKSVYDWTNKRFKPRSPGQMVKEYKAAYTGFVKYRRRLRRTPIR